MTNRYYFCRTTLLAALTYLLAMGSAVAQANIHFDLPEQTLEESLRSIGKSADINILIDRSLVVGRKAAALSGELSAEQAITRLLQGTGLTHRFVNENTVVLASVAAKPA